VDVTSIADQLFFATVRIDTADAKGQKGSGTGFLFAHTRDGKEYPFVVTNKHVAKDADKGGITFIKRRGDKPSLGDAFRIDFDNFETVWHGHPDPEVDITVTPLVPLVKFMEGRGVEVFYRLVASTNIPTEDQLKELDAIEDVVFVGYPNGIWDQKNYIPIARTGTTATPLSIDYEGQKKFLIDASVFGGSSGSPVFIYKSGAFATKGGPTKIGTLFYFVGVVAAVYFKTAAHDIISLPIPTNMRNVALDKEMLDLGIVFKGSTVVEAVEAAIIKFGA